MLNGDFTELNEYKINRIISAYKRKKAKEGKNYSLDNFLDFIDNITGNKRRIGRTYKIKSDSGTLIINFEGTYEIEVSGIKGMTINKLIAKLIAEAQEYEPPEVNIFDYVTNIDFLSD